MTRVNASAGARDRQVTIQQLSESKGASNAPVETWTDLRQAWANKADIAGRERFVADQQSAPYDTVWTLPWMADLNPELVDVRKDRRLVVNGRVHDIVEAREIGRREAIEVRTLAGGLS